jgi:hypothetical protein
VRSVELPLGELQLRLLLVSREGDSGSLPDDDWLWCDVEAETTSFSGRFRWTVMARDLALLADDLDALYERYPERGSVDFTPIEANVTLSFCIATTGAVLGEYSLRDDVATGDELRGSFTTEQPRLPDIAKSIRTFLRA